MKLIDILVSSGDGMSLFGLRTKYLAMDPDGRVYGYTEMPTPGIIGWSVPDNLYSTDGRGCLIQIDRDDVDGQWQSAIITREQYEAALAAKNDGWIEWGGGECPVPEGTLVDVRYRDGDESHHAGAGTSFDKTGSNPDRNAKDWSNDGSLLDIIAYRLHKPQEAEQPKADDEEDLNECIWQDAAPVWGGEGKPAIGEKCEHHSGGQWEAVTIAGIYENLVTGFTDYWMVKEDGSSYTVGNPYRFRPIRSEADKRREDAKHTIAELCRSASSNGHAADLIYDAIAAGKIPGVKLED